MIDSLAKVAAVAAIAFLTSAASGGAQTLTQNADQCTLSNAPASTIAAAVPEVPAVLQVNGLASGTTMVQVDIDAEGHVLDTSIAKTSGVYGLDQAALKAARASTFAPQVRNCVGVAGSYLFEVDFPG
jgi:TonB family protein